MQFELLDELASRESLGRLSRRPQLFRIPASAKLPNTHQRHSVQMPIAMKPIPATPLRVRSLTC
jgi:hypothetical protein